MKNAFGSTPCGPPENCHIVDCGSDEGITDKDLAILSNQEYPKVEPENEKDNEEQKDKRSQRECTRKKEKNEENTEERRKKRPCRKVIKNPFFTNRLKFSTDLPPRPPLPPPQFFPLAGEDSKPKVCIKKKKCKKRKKTKTEYEEEECEEEEEDECEEETECDENSCACKDECEGKAKRRCKKPKDSKAYAPCRKKLSDSSIPPQPRRIPALLKDLPLTCPKNIPEVERQIRMSQDHDLQRNACKKKCKRKEKVEELLNS